MSKYNAASYIQEFRKTIACKKKIRIPSIIKLKSVSCQRYHRKQGYLGTGNYIGYIKEFKYKIFYLNNTDKKKMRSGHIKVRFDNLTVR